MKHITLCWVVTLGLVCVVARAEVVQVEVKKARLTEEPKSLSKVVAEVKHGDQLQVRKKEKSWWQVQPEGLPAGWIPRSALASAKTALKSGDASEQSGVSKDEQALAFRPFSERVERQYRADNPMLTSGYAALDKIERGAAYEPEPDTAAFLRAGQVQTGGKP